MRKDREFFERYVRARARACGMNAKVEVKRDGNRNNHIVWVTIPLGENTLSSSLVIHDHEERSKVFFRSCADGVLNRIPEYFVEVLRGMLEDRGMSPVEMYFNQDQNWIEVRFEEIVPLGAMIFRHVIDMRKVYACRDPMIEIAGAVSQIVKKCRNMNEAFLRRESNREEVTIILANLGVRK